MKKRIRQRTLLFGGIMTLLFLILISRVYYFQVVGGGNYYEMAKKRWAASETLVAKRGSILDREGNILAMDTLAYNISVNPKIIHQSGIEDEVVQGLHAILGIPIRDLELVVNAQKKNGDYYVQRELRKGGWQIEKALADQIRELKTDIREVLEEKNAGTDDGIYINGTLERYYPRNFLASQLIGYVSLDRETMTGVEAYFNDKLTGEDGYIHYEKDGQRVQLSKGEVDYKPAIDGNNITLTIDSEIQYYVEEALRGIVEKYAPLSATAIAADPNTMEILAIANMPEFNPNSYWESDYANYYNHAIYSLYEPGSTFKIATLAASVEEGLFDPNELYKSGSIKVPGDSNLIYDHDPKGWGTISFLDGLKYSSNVAFTKLGFEKLGGDLLKDYFTRFGFGQQTGIQLTNEPAGNIRFQYNRDIAAAAFGQGVLVTPIQQVAAVAAVANGGRLLEPQIVKSITDPVTKTTTMIEPKLVRQVISEETSRLVGEYLEQVVSDLEKGSGKNAYIDGYRVAGKTGTAQKFIDGKYSDEKYFVSFVGYAPVDNPKIVIYIAVDEPNDSKVGGGTVAAPAFKEIVLNSLRKMDIAPTNEVEVETDDREVTVTVPNLTELEVIQAKGVLKNAGLAYELVGKGGQVLQQVPLAGTSVHPSQSIYLITEQDKDLSIPDLIGVSLRDALEIASLVNARLVPEGTGYVVSQTTEEVDGERLIKVVLAPPIELNEQGEEIVEEEDIQETESQ